jgi:condensation domain-containing protein
VDSAVLAPSQTLTVTSSGPGAELPPTWGQRCIWGWHGMGGAEVRFAHAGSYSLESLGAGGCRVDDLVDAVRRVVGRHDALRTRLVHEGGQLVGQVVDATGELTIDVYVADESSAHSVGEAIAKEQADRFWTGREWPLRVSIVAVDDIAVYVVASQNRLVFDTESMRIVLEEMAALAADPAADLATRYQSIEESRFEHSADGAAVSEKAGEFWRAGLRRTPPSLFDFPPPEPEGKRHIMAPMRSAAVARAVPVLRRRWRVSDAAVVLTAVATALTAYTGHRAVPAQILSANRTDRVRKNMVGTLVSEGLVLVDLTLGSFGDITRNTETVMRLANRNAYCDPDVIARVREEVERDRGAPLDLTIFFNDVLTARQTVGQVDPVDDLSDLVADGSGLPPIEQWHGWEHAIQGRTCKEIRLLLSAEQHEDLPLLLFADTAHISRAAVRDIFLGAERLLVAAARDGDVAGADLAAACGIATAPRPETWIELADGWVDLPASAAAWRAVAEPAPAELALGDDGLLVGCLGGDAEPSFVDLHRRFMASIGGTEGRRAPARYRWVSLAGGTPDRPKGWLDLPVLAEGTGR